MGRWTSQTLAEVVALQRGHDLPTSDRVAGSVPIIGSFGVTGLHNFAKYSGPGVAIGRSGASIGKATWVDGEFWPLNTCLFVTDFKGNDPRWVFRLLGTIDFAGFNSGSAQPSLNRNYLAGIPVVVPPLPEQEAIAEILGALDDKIAANERAMMLADDLAQATAAHVFGGVATLGEIAQITMGSSPPGTSYNEVGTGLPFFQGVRDFGMRSPARRVFTTEPLREADVGDTLISVRAPVGRVNVAVERLCLGRGLAGVRSTSGTPRTLMHQIAASDSWEPYNSEGTVFGAINKAALARASVPAVSNERSAELEVELEGLETLIAARLLESSTLTATRDALLPLLMSGKLRVKDADKKIEEVL